MGEAGVPDAGRSLRELVEDEMLRRFNDPVEAAKMPAHSLARVYDSVVRRGEPDKPDLDEDDLDVLEIIASTDLPAERKRELINAELDLLAARRQELSDALEVEDERPAVRP